MKLPGAAGEDCRATAQARASCSACLACFACLVCCLAPSLACSAQTQNEIDARVVALVKAEHEKARKLLEENRTLLDKLSAFLYEKETITGDEFMQIVNENKEAKA